MGDVVGRITPLRHDPAFVLKEALWHIETGGVKPLSTIMILGATPSDENDMRGLYVWKGGAETAEDDLLDTLHAALDQVLNPTDDA